MNKPYELVILIDDDNIFNYISSTYIRKLFQPKTVEVLMFNQPAEALEYLSAQEPLSLVNAIIFLDINMPVLTGWELLDTLAETPAGIAKLFELYMLSSSIDPQDKQRAQSYPLVDGFLSKPLTKQLDEIFTSSIIRSNTLIQN